MKNVRYLCQAAIIASLYACLSILFMPISFGAIQCRISEALVILPVLTSAAIPGVTIGCFISNLLGSGVVADMVFGTMATLIGAILTYQIAAPFRRKLKDSLKDAKEDVALSSRIPLRVMSVLPPIITNSIIVPLILKYAYMLDEAYLFMVFTVGVGEILSAGVLGNILLSVLCHKSILKELLRLDVI